MKEEASEGEGLATVRCIDLYRGGICGCLECLGCVSTDVAVVGAEDESSVVTSVLASSRAAHSGSDGAAVKAQGL